MVNIKKTVPFDQNLKFLAIRQSIYAIAQNQIERPLVSMAYPMKKPITNFYKILLAKQQFMKAKELLTSSEDAENGVTSATIAALEQALLRRALLK